MIYREGSDRPVFDVEAGNFSEANYNASQERRVVSQGDGRDFRVRRIDEDTGLS